MITKIVKQKVTCPRTGEVYTVNKLVTVQSPNQDAIDRTRETNEQRFCNEAASEAAATRRHRQLTPDVQKIGWR